MRYGLVKNIATYNPLRIAFHELIALTRDALQPGISLGARLMYVFGPPGWSHDGSRKTAKVLKQEWAARQQGPPEQAGAEQT